ncbi:hypothetical protein HK099_002561 [Clydaea vesicula]|uniref:Zn(2)-C6 fungal-type domain-containing protein n=1 Tax=Clydaea vesicula TaxID=447962 RepID=A0AAD5U2J8_9FUNG|nr:hypothetical protein HK099_002561 [Clydaea vesicula]
MGNLRGMVSKQACDMCRLRKRKCDSVKPFCSKCVMLGQDCVYREICKKRGVKNTLDKSIEKIKVSLTTLRESFSENGENKSESKLKKKDKLPQEKNLNTVYENNPNLVNDNSNDSNFTKNGSLQRINKFSAQTETPSVLKSNVDFSFYSNPDNFSNLKKFFDDLNQMFLNNGDGVFNLSNYHVLLKTLSNQNLLLAYGSDSLRTYLPNSIQDFPYFKIGVDEKLKHFIRNNIPVVPNDCVVVSAIELEEGSDHNAAEDLNLKNENLLYLHLNRTVYQKNHFYLAAIKSYSANKRNLFNKYYLSSKKVFCEVEFAKLMISNLNDYSLYLSFALGCLRSRHYLLFTEKFGGSPYKASMLFAKMTSDILKTVVNSDEIYSIGYIEIKLQDIGYLFNFDKPNPENKFQKLYNDIEDIQARKIIWARVVRFTKKNGHFHLQDFSVFNAIDILDLHNKLIEWHDIIFPEKFRIFESLMDFWSIRGVKSLEHLNWNLRLCNMQLNIWYLWALIKIHSSQLNETRKFKLSPLSEIEGSSLDIILCSIRALSSILLLKLPEKKFKNFESVQNRELLGFCNLDKEFLPIVLSPTFEILLGESFKDIIEICLEKLKCKAGWSQNEDLQWELLSFHFKGVLLKILETRENPFCIRITKSLRTQIGVALDILEIKNLYN